MKCGHVSATPSIPSPKHVTPPLHSSSDRASGWMPQPSWSVSIHHDLEPRFTSRGGAALKWTCPCGLPEPRWSTPRPLETLLRNFWLESCQESRKAHLAPVDGNLHVAILIYISARHRTGKARLWKRNIGKTVRRLSGNLTFVPTHPRTNLQYGFILLSHIIGNKKVCIQLVHTNYESHLHIISPVWTCIDVVAHPEYGI
jgi:hypothetical protein